VCSGISPITFIRKKTPINRLKPDILKIPVK